MDIIIIGTDIIRTSGTFQLNKTRCIKKHFQFNLLGEFVKALIKVSIYLFEDFSLVELPA